jgi:hypothetical protein
MGKIRHLKRLKKVDKDDIFQGCTDEGDKIRCNRHLKRQRFNFRSGFNRQV